MMKLWDDASVPRILGHAVVLTLVCASVGWLLMDGQSGRADPSGNAFAGGMLGEASRQIDLGPVRPAHLYAVTVSAKDPSQFHGQNSVRVRIADAQGVLAEKWLHTADLDFYVTIRPRSSGHIILKLASPTRFLPEVATSLRRIAGATSSAKRDQGVIAAQPNGTWQTAQPFEFGQTIYGSADERPYAPAPTEDAYAALLQGFQWFRFKYRGNEPRLAFFLLDITDREVPVDVDIFEAGRNASGESDVVPYTDGQFVYQIEATQNHPGLYKFRTRILKPGQAYYVRIYANHPSYQLRTYDYPVPPYKEPGQAVRTGMDFLVNLGDTWLSNTPRRGAVALRTTMVHAETKQCIACHPTQFTTRGYLTGIANGYPPTQRPALEFLTDRIYNNARPLYGVPGANWVRVIYTARTVASRLPVIERLFEQNVTHDPPRLNFNIPYARFLDIHYKDRKEMPGDEADGCEPSVSPLEIATQSWETYAIVYHQTGDPQWQEKRDTVERLAVAYDPKNIIDLNWKIHLLATIGREKYAHQLDELISQLYSYQLPDGMWPYLFDKKAKPADFISYHSILALALAGRRPETDPRLERAVESCLAAQRPEGDWEGDPVYQGFNTPFRATQFAVMALSTLYPGPDKRPASEKGWSDAFAPPPKHLARGDLPRLLTQLDQFWDLAPQPVLKRIRKVLASSEQPLAREAAARALGHMADPRSVQTLIDALGDRSKMVQRTSAWALRMILERRPDVADSGRALLTSALRSLDPRTRWGAAQLFNQHFKSLTDDPRLRAALTANLNDPVPYIRLLAAQGLWQWYYWQIDKHEARTDILEAMTARLNVETDPIARRALHESVYNMLDENTGYLEAWVAATSTKQDQERIVEGYQSVVRDQSLVLARALHSATSLGRQGILESMWDFHVRHYSFPPTDQNTVDIALPAVFVKYLSGVPDLHRPNYEYPPYREAVTFKYDVHNSFFQTRVGNDSDLIHFFPSSGPELEDALIDSLQGSDSSTKINVLKAGSTLGGAGDDRFAEAVLKLTMDPDKQVREAVAYVYQKGQRGVLNIDTHLTRAAGSTGAAAQADDPAPSLVQIVVDVLKHGSLESREVVLPILADLPRTSAWTRQPEVVNALRALLEREPRSDLYAQVLKAASSFPMLVEDLKVRDQVLAGLYDHDAEVLRAAVQMCLEHFLRRPDTLPPVQTAFEHLGSRQRAVLMEEVSNPRFMRHHLGVVNIALSRDPSYLLKSNEQELDFLDDPVVLKTVLDSLQDLDANVRAAALDTLQKVKNIEQRPEFGAFLKRLRNDPNTRLRLIATNVLNGKKLSAALEDVQPGSVLDFNYYLAKVEPILATPGADGKACVMCHANHVIFKLLLPNSEGKFAPFDSKDNYKYVMRVVDIGHPTQSLILIKPTRPTDAEGNVDDYLATHNGGQRWPGNESSWQYKTILDWIRGAHLDNGQP